MLSSRELQIKLMEDDVERLAGTKSSQSLWLFSVNSFAGTSSEASAFLSSFPKKMVCSGAELNFITSTRVEMPQQMTIEISGQQTDAPMIEVTAPSASHRNHFKIGNGFGARLEQIGRYLLLHVPVALVTMLVNRTEIHFSLPPITVSR